jgi:hypothetical protein
LTELGKTWQKMPIEVYFCLIWQNSAKLGYLCLTWQNLIV